MQKTVSEQSGARAAVLKMRRVLADLLAGGSRRPERERPRVGLWKGAGSRPGVSVSDG